MYHPRSATLLQFIVCSFVTLLVFLEANSQDDTGRKISQSKQTAVAYQKNVLPILTTNCNPCHFPGGKVYDEYPFDDQKTAAKLGKRLFTRIKDEKQQAAITLWLNTISAKPDSSAPRRGKKH